MRTNANYGALAVSLLFAAASTAASQDLVANINVQEAPALGWVPDSDPGGFTSIGARTYFSAAGSGLGRVLYWTGAPGAAPQLLVDVDPSAGPKDPQDLIELPSGQFLFTAQTPATGREWFVSDGTSAGTTLLTEMVLGSFDGFIGQPTLHQGEVYFFATDANSPSRALWKTDGTAAGTERLEVLGLGGGLPVPGEQIVSAGGTLYYAFNDVGTSGPFWELWSTSGTVGGASKVIEVLESSFSGVRELTAVGSKLVFVAQGQGTGFEPWVSDGTALGTWPVQLMPGAAGSAPSGLTALGNHVYFAADDPTVGRELFRLDGSASSLKLVEDLNPGAAGSSPDELAVLNGALYFSGDDGVHGDELWSTSGAPGAASLFAEFAAGAAGSAPRDLVALGAQILCVAGSASTGAELYASDGTVAGTGLVADIVPGSSSSNPVGLFSNGAQVFFAATTEATGTELWRSDGTGVGTLETEMATVPFDQGSDPRYLTSIGGQLVFVANDGLNGIQPWASDGAPGGTGLLATVPSPSSPPIVAGEFRGRAYINVNSALNQWTLYQSDGTPAGTVPANLGIGSGFAGVKLVLRDRLLFTIGIDSDLYSTDGTAAGTVLLAQLSNQTGAFFAAGDYVYFRNWTSQTGKELWRTDGTPQGTQLVADIWPGPQWGVTDDFYFEAGSLGGLLYFRAETAANQTELWRTDGTVAGTELFADLNPLGGSYPSDFRTVDNHLFFSAYVDGGRYLFATDGVSVEQVLDAPLEPGMDGFANDQVYFVIQSVGGEPKLLSSDGTAAGTGIVADLGDAPVVFLRGAWKVTSGAEVLFSIYGGGISADFWVTDGTAAGTYQVTETLDTSIFEVDAPDELVRVGSEIYFRAWNQDLGGELFSLPIAAFGGWVAEPFGVGCAGSSGLAPTIGASGEASLGSTLTVELAGAAASAPVAHYFDFDYGLGAVGGCDVYLAAPKLLLLDSTDAVGAVTLSLAIPNDPVLAGIELWLQSVVADPGGGLAGVGALTPALEVIVRG
ncbi:hypothetical protein [Engelhardtia mirabilis]|uniref:ELWxxDGT repeat protein n=1 Tax=Engelhardtia mirabilis TaxID=2528011 RepID=A0A518BG09_9BACT|nr:hypothetical protein Pla133_09780 [Planctomycetes bacterium Pla133]QDV00238.1 hypothetical protein Pla86_09770 [Planctomycetes bacterium Pla86]